MPKRSQAKKPSARPRGLSVAQALQDVACGLEEIADAIRGGSSIELPAAAIDTVAPPSPTARYVPLAADCRTVVAAGSKDHVVTWAALPFDPSMGICHALPYLNDGKPAKQAQMKELARELRLGKHTDWRLPQESELSIERDLSKHNPCINAQHFPGTKAEYHWTATPVPGYSDCAFVVGFGFGGVGLNLVDFNSSHARAVRGPVPRPGQ